MINSTVRPLMLLGRPRNCSILVATFLLAACGNSVPSNGFGDVEYGMSSAELKRRGFTCDADTCSRDQPSAAAEDALGMKPDSVRANLANDAVTSISLDFLVYSTDETISAYTKAYGKPRVCRFRNAIAATVEDHVWSANRGVTITVSKILDYGVLPNLGQSRTSTATYRDANENKTFRADRC